MASTGTIHTATVTTYNRKSGWALLEHSNYPQGLELFCPCFFGGEFAPYPRVGQDLQVKIDSLGKVVEAWHPKKNSKLYIMYTNHLRVVFFCKFFALSIN